MDTSKYYTANQKYKHLLRTIFSTIVLLAENYRLSFGIYTSYILRSTPICCRLAPKNLPEADLIS